ncbi:hypothetical protein F4778DRAFT_686977 [Xylariomycetidae sp. FL2044]|nr:hypothetical protein F4778DRAFT_686977 [Xylariomycetidae sp. FL2044]
MNHQAVADHSHQPYEMQRRDAQSWVDQNGVSPYQQPSGEHSSTYDQYGVFAHHANPSQAQLGSNYPQGYPQASYPANGAGTQTWQWHHHEPALRNDARAWPTEQDNYASPYEHSDPSVKPVAHHELRGRRKSSWWPWARTAEQKINENWAKQFSGGRGFNGHFFRKPTAGADAEQGHVVLDRPGDYGGAVNVDADGRFMYRNHFGQVETKYSDVAVYLSPTNFRPKRLVVQSCDYVLGDKHAGGDWRRRKMNGQVPKALRLSEWALQPFENGGAWGKLSGAMRLLAVSVPLQVLLAFPGSSSWQNEDVGDTYTDFPGYHWQWAKHAINPLDQKPTVARPAAGELLPSSRRRLVRPRKLYVQQQPGGPWGVVDNPPRNLPYVFVSYAAKSFRADGSNGLELIRGMARAATLQAGCTACWVDTDCIEQSNGAQKDADIYGMCDVIRASRRVVVILPDDRVETRKFWGTRMWTLPEALLAPGVEIDFLARVGGEGGGGRDGYRTTTLSLIEMTGEIWDDPVDSELTGGSTRLLAEHFSNELTLSRLELLAVAIDACVGRSRMDYTMFTANDVTLAVMGLLHNRLERDDGDTAFQSLVRMSLGNDSDRIIERMVSLYPPPPPPPPPSQSSSCSSSSTTGWFNPFYQLSHPDQFATHLWDVQPSCYVVGVAHEDNTVLLDSCRVMHIRWKGFPRIVVARDYGLRKLLATFFVTAGMWWFVQGLSFAVYYAPFLSVSRSDGDLYRAMQWMIAGFLLVAVLLSVFGPFSVRRLFGGQVLQSTSNLVGFEGVMPLDQLERLVFGNNSGRLNYEPSSTPICALWRDPELRVGREPDWVASGGAGVALPEGHRLFTLVDTGTLTVSIFSAERPPTVALLCGREGGMLRAVLCSWQFENDCLYKETVIRMSSSVWDSANLKGWLKVCLATMNQQRQIERGRRMAEFRAEQESPGAPDTKMAEVRVQVSDRG